MTPLISRRMRRPALAIASGAWGIAVVWGISTAGQRHAGPVDRMLIEHVHRAVGDGRGLARLLLVPADTPMIVAVALVSCVAALARRRWDVALLAVVTPMIGVATTELVLKPLFDRRLHGYLSYPSGHAIAAVAGYTVVALALASTSARPWRRVTAAGWGLVVVIVMAGLVGMDWHYPTDTVGGVCVAVGVVLPCASVTDAYLRKPLVHVPLPRPAPTGDLRPTESSTRPAVATAPIARSVPSVTRRRWARDGRRRTG